MNLKGSWIPFDRRNSASRSYEEWFRHDGRPQGWSLMYQADRGVLEVTLQVPQVMAPGQLSNYPLHLFDINKLERISGPMAKALGMSGDPMSAMKWDSFGVRSADFTIDLPTTNMRAVLRAFRDFPRSGKQTCWSSTIQWVSGGKVVRIYDKGRQVKAKQSRGNYAHILQRYPELPSMLRLEIHLSATELRRLFKLKSGWLPKLELVTSEDIALHVLQREVRNGFKIGRLRKTKKQHTNQVVGLALAIKEKADALYGSTSWSRLSQLALLHVLAGQLNADEIEERFGVSPSQRRKLAVELRDIGMPPGSPIDPIDHNRFHALWMAFAERYPGAAAVPKLSPWEKEHKSIDATWLVEPDVERSVEGLVVTDYWEEQELLGLLG